MVSPGSGTVPPLRECGKWFISSFQAFTHLVSSRRSLTQLAEGRERERWGRCAFRLARRVHSGELPSSQGKRGSCGQAGIQGQDVAPAVSTPHPVPFLPCWRAFSSVSLHLLSLPSAWWGRPASGAQQQSLLSPWLAAGLCSGPGRSHPGGANGPGDRGRGPERQPARLPAGGVHGPGAGGGCPR